MQNGHSAFLGSEYVRVRDAPTLAALRERYTTDSPISLHTVFPGNMAGHAGERVQIMGVSYYHMGFVLYELREIGGGTILPEKLRLPSAQPRIFRAGEQVPGPRFPPLRS